MLRRKALLFAAITYMSLKREWNRLSLVARARTLTVITVLLVVFPIVWVWFGSFVDAVLLCFVFGFLPLGLFHIYYGIDLDGSSIPRDKNSLCDDDRDGDEKEEEEEEEEEDADEQPLRVTRKGNRRNPTRVNNVNVIVVGTKKAQYIALQFRIDNQPVMVMNGPLQTLPGVQSTQLRQLLNRTNVLVNDHVDFSLTLALRRVIDALLRCTSTSKHVHESIPIGAVLQAYLDSTFSNERLVGSVVQLDLHGHTHKLSLSDSVTKLLRLFQNVLSRNSGDEFFDDSYVGQEADPGAVENEIIGNQRQSLGGIRRRDCQQQTFLPEDSFRSRGFSSIPDDFSSWGYNAVPKGNPVRSLWAPSTVGPAPLSVFTTSPCGTTGTGDATGVGSATSGESNGTETGDLNVDASF